MSCVFMFCKLAALQSALSGASTLCTLLDCMHVQCTTMYVCVHEHRCICEDANIATNFANSNVTGGGGGGGAMQFFGK